MRSDYTGLGEGLANRYSFVAFAYIYNTFVYIFTLNNIFFVLKNQTTYNIFWTFSVILV